MCSCRKCTRGKLLNVWLDEYMAHMHGDGALYDEHLLYTNVTINSNKKNTKFISKLTFDASFATTASRSSSSTSFLGFVQHQTTIRIAPNNRKPRLTRNKAKLTSAETLECKHKHEHVIFRVGKVFIHVRVGRNFVCHVQCAGEDWKYSEGED